MKGPAWHVVASGNWARGWKWEDGPQRPLAEADRCVPRTAPLAHAVVAPVGLLRVKVEAHPWVKGFN